jgi:hypothetical protein
MVMATMAIAFLAVLAMSMVAIQMDGAVEQHRGQAESRALLAAEAGLSEAYMELETSGDGVVGSQDAPVKLSSGRVFVTKQTFGPTNKLVRLTSTARVGNSNARAELVLRDNVDTIFVWGAFGDTDINLSSQAKVDSYDSTLGTYASQAIHGSGSNTWANNAGNIGSNGDVQLKQNALVFGNAAPGPTGTISVLGSAVVSGSTANSTAAVPLAPIVLPVIVSTGNVTYSANTTLAAGNHHTGATVINTGKTLTVIGPATLIFDSLVMKSGSRLMVDSTNGPVDIYVVDDFIMNSNTLLSSDNRDPRAVRVNLLSDNIINPEVLVDLDEIGLESNASLYGTIYAPDARIDVKSNFEIFGALIAEEVVLASNSRVHYDEALSKVLAPGARRYTRVTWLALH